MTKTKKIIHVALVGTEPNRSFKNHSCRVALVTVHLCRFCRRLRLESRNKVLF